MIVMTTADWLGTAASWRFASLLFQAPTRDGQAELRALVSELPESRRDAARRLAAEPFDVWEAEYHRALGPGGCPACESSYDDNALAGRGPLLAEIAGFYHAFAYQPALGIPEVPDHISIELGFLSYLAMKAAFAEHGGRAEQLIVAREGYHRFLEEHPVYWFDRFQEALMRTGCPLYAAASDWLAECCRAAGPVGAT